MSTNPFKTNVAFLYLLKTCFSLLYSGSYLGSFSIQLFGAAPKDRGETLLYGMGTTLDMRNCAHGDESVHAICTKRGFRMDKIICT